MSERDGDAPSHCCPTGRGGGAQRGRKRGANAQLSATRSELLLHFFGWKAEDGGTERKKPVDFSSFNRAPESNY